LAQDAPRKDYAYVSPEDGYHVRIGSKEYFALLFDENKFTELTPQLTSADPLQFVDMQPYTQRLQAAQEKTQLKDAIRVAHGRMHGLELVIGQLLERRLLRALTML